MDFLSANSGFAVQNDGTYLPRITRETCTSFLEAKKIFLKIFEAIDEDVNGYLSDKEFKKFIISCDIQVKYLK